MSIRAIDWVFKQDIRPSSLKFVLVSLADHAGQSGTDSLVWPSVASICEKTSQDVKTVLKSLAKLEEMGLLRDSGQRCGRTGQIKVYEIVGIPEVSQHHYTYRLDSENGDFYIGVRSSYKSPEDDKYMGSGRWTHKQRGLKKTILGSFSSRAEAEVEEGRLIFHHSSNPKCKNILKRLPKTEAFRISRITQPKTDILKTTENGIRNRDNITVKESSIEPKSDSLAFIQKWTSYHKEYRVTPRDAGQLKLFFKTTALKFDDLWATYIRALQGKGWHCTHRIKTIAGLCSAYNEIISELGPERPADTRPDDDKIIADLQAQRGAE